MKKIKHIVRISGAYLIQLVGRIHPLDDRTVLLYVYNRKGLCCNPKYILKSLHENYPDYYRIYWISKWPETVERQSWYKVIRLRSIRFYLLSGYAGYIISNDLFDNTLLKRKGQIYIETWHGGGLFKKAGYDIVGDKIKENAIKAYYGNIDYLISSNEKLTDIFQKAFRIDRAHILPFGMPRSDVLKEDKEIYRDVRKAYGLDLKKKIVLYAPTFREGLNTDYLIPENLIDSVLKSLRLRFGGDWAFLYKLHYFEDKAVYAGLIGKVINCSNYYDTQELLCAVDVLITDYSSLLWDYTLLKRPSFRYAPDLRKYEKDERGFYVPYGEWPYPYAENIHDLLNVIETYEAKIYREKEEEFLDYTGNYDLGHSSEQFTYWLRTSSKDGKE